MEAPETADEAEGGTMRLPHQDRGRRDRLVQSPSQWDRDSVVVLEAALEAVLAAEEEEVAVVRHPVEAQKAACGTMRCRQSNGRTKWTWTWP